MFSFILAMPISLLSDDDSQSSDEQWWSRRRSKRLLKEKKEAEEEQKQQRRHWNTWGGSKPGKMHNIDRDREQFRHQLIKDYFIENPTYPDKYFRRKLFLCI